jgi:hypothetical protein
VVYLLVISYWIKYSQNPVLLRCAWGTAGGAITGLQNFVKDTLTIIKATEHGHFPWFFPLFIVLGAAAPFVGLLLLTACMKRYDATFSAAAFVGSFVVSASLMSAVHYNTIQSLKNAWNFVLYPSGLLILMIGVYILVSEDDKKKEEEVTEPVRKDSEDSQVCQRFLFSYFYMHTPPICSLNTLTVSRNLSCTNKLRTRTTPKSFEMESSHLIPKAASGKKGNCSIRVKCEVK